MSDQSQQPPETTEEQYDARGLIDLYSQMRRRGALLVWGALLLAVILVILASITQPVSAPELTPEATDLTFYVLSSVLS
ncbi:MAG: hypothetical protein ACPG7F_04465 [Aggregatilineales bacterium]